MKKTSTFALLSACLLIMLVSCGGGGSLEGDAKKLAELQCKVTDLSKKAAAGDMSYLQESLKLATEAAELEKNLKTKYTTDQDKAQFAEVFLRELKKCE